MREEFIGAIDQGTTGTRCILFNREGRPVASAGDHAQSCERLALVAGLLPEAAQVLLCQRLAPGGTVAPEDVLLLGPLAAGPTGPEARAALLAAVRGAMTQPPERPPGAAPWARACERAWADLVAADRDEEAAALRSAVEEILREYRHPLSGEALRRRWPRPVDLEVVPLTELESPLPAP